MTVLWFDGLLAQSAEAGVYFLPESDREELREAAAVNRFPCLPVDLRDCADKTALLQRLAEALHFPDYFGHNWDALNDCLAGLQRPDTGGLVLLLEHSQTLRRDATENFKTAMEVLQSVSQDWARRQAPFWTFIVLADAEFDALG